MGGHFGGYSAGACMTARAAPRDPVKKTPVCGLSAVRGKELTFDRENKFVGYAYPDDERDMAAWDRINANGGRPHSARGYGGENVFHTRAMHERQGAQTMGGVLDYRHNEYIPDEYDHYSYPSGPHPIETGYGGAVEEQDMDPHVADIEQQLRALRQECARLEGAMSSTEIGQRILSPQKTGYAKYKSQRTAAPGSPVFTTNYHADRYQPQAAGGAAYDPRSSAPVPMHNNFTSEAASQGLFHHDRLQKDHSGPKRKPMPASTRQSAPAGPQRGKQRSSSPPTSRPESRASNGPGDDMGDLDDMFGDVDEDGGVQSMAVPARQDTARSSAGSQTSSARRRATMPQPFAFESREKDRPKTIAQQRLEKDLALRQAMEEAEHNKRFKAKERPASSYPGGYEKLKQQKEKARAHRIKESKEKLRQSEKPFNFAIRDHFYAQDKKLKALEEKEEVRKWKAKPPPVSTSLPLMEMMKQKDEMRAARRSAMAQESLKRSALPPRMEAHSKEKGPSKAKALQEARDRLDPECTFKPKTGKPVPNFAEVHAKQESELKAKMAVEKNTTKRFVPMNLSQTDSKAARDKIREEMDREIKQKEYRWPFFGVGKQLNMPKGAPMQQKTVASSNNATQLRNELRHREKDELHAKEIKTKEEDQWREERSKTVGKDVRAYMERTMPNSSAEDKQAEAKAKQKRLELDQKKENKRATDERNAKVAKYPMVMERATRDAAKQKMGDEVDTLLETNGTPIPTEADNLELRSP